MEIILSHNDKIVNNEISFEFFLKIHNLRTIFIFQDLSQILCDKTAILFKSILSKFAFSLSRPCKFFNLMTSP